MANIKEKNVFFKSGSQARYDALTSRDPGTFYVTHDTHRLYLGNDLLSQAVEIVTSLPDKSDARVASGTIFYLEGKNILAIFDKTVNEWVQLNPDTRIQEMSLTTNAADGAAEVSLIVKENRHTDNNAIDNTFSQKIKFSGAKGITVTSNAQDSLVITAPELTVGTGADGKNAKIGLDTKVVPIVGDGSTAVSYDSANGQIKISSSYENTRVTGGEVVTDNASSTGFDVSVHLESKTNGNPDPADGITLAKGNIDPIIKVATGKNESGLVYNSSDIKFKDGIAKVDTYSTSYLDQKFQDTLNQVNSMTYKGKLAINGGIATLPTSGVHIGDTYILPEAAQVNGPGSLNETYQPGTLFIAKGTEGVDGVIGSDLSFDSVLTSDSDTTYTLVSEADGTLSFRNSTNPGADQSTIEIAGDSYINATITHKSDNTAHATISVNHKDLGFTSTKDASAKVTQNKGETKTFTVVDSITQDKGHITGVTTKDIEVRDTVTNLSNADFQVIKENNGVKIGLDIQDNQEGGVSSEFKITSNTLTLSADTADTTGKTIKAELVWGSFDE